MSGQFVKLSDLMSILDRVQPPKRLLDESNMNIALPDGVSKDVLDVKSMDDIKALGKILEEAMLPEAVEIIPGLFIGNKKAVMDTAFLKSKSVTYILNVAAESDELSYVFGVRVDKEKLEGIKIQNEGNILVNCFAGLHRSTTTVAAYLLLYHEMPMPEVLSLIKSKRDVAISKMSLTALATMHNLMFTEASDAEEARPKDAYTIEWAKNPLFEAIASVVGRQQTRRNM